MAKDLTISIAGKNPDGTYSATIGGVDPGNPLLQGGSGTASTGSGYSVSPPMLTTVSARLSFVRRSKA